MTGDDDLSYFRRRAAQEHARASGATHISVRRAHLELAALYTARLRDAETDRPIRQAMA